MGPVSLHGRIKALQSQDVKERTWCFSFFSCKNIIEFFRQIGLKFFLKIFLKEKTLMNCAKQVLD